MLSRRQKGRSRTTQRPPMPQHQGPQQEDEHEEMILHVSSGHLGWGRNTIQALFKHLNETTKSQGRMPKSALTSANPLGLIHPHTPHPPPKKMTCPVVWVTVNGILVGGLLGMVCILRLWGYGGWDSLGKV
jgi:hypothetical protein